MECEEVEVLEEYFEEVDINSEEYGPDASMDLNLLGLEEYDEGRSTQDDVRNVGTLGWCDYLDRIKSGLLPIPLLESLFMLDYSENEKCPACGIPVSNIFREAFGVFANILLNNYKKNKNSGIDSTRSSATSDPEKAKSSRK